MIHNEVGAGKSRVKRPFFGLSDKELDEIEAFIGDRVGRNLRVSASKR
jgi:hypothetical protein